MKTALFSLLLACAIITTSCTKPTTTITPTTTTYDNSFTINGGVFKNTSVGFKNVTQSSGYYFATGNKLTNIDITANTGDSLTVIFSLTFSGNKTGTFSLDPNNYITIAINSSHGTSIDLSTNSATGSIVSNRYDAVGGKIGGTFGGTFSGSDGNTYTITNGTFLVARISDK